MKKKASSKRYIGSPALNIEAKVIPAVPTSGSDMVIVYTVSNEGNMALKDVSLQDAGATVVCPQVVGSVSVIAVGGVAEFTCPMKATVSGTNIMTVTAYPVDSNVVQASGTSVLDIVVNPASAAPAEGDEPQSGEGDEEVDGAVAPSGLTIDTDKSLVPAAAGAVCEAGSLIKGSLDTVYYCGIDGNRYVFPSSAVFFSWFPDFSSVVTVDDGILASIPLAGNITFRPGSLVKVTYDPKVYMVDDGGVLRWIASEGLAESLFGSGWASLVRDLPEEYIPDYSYGADIAVASDYAL